MSEIHGKKIVDEYTALSL